MIGGDPRLGRYERMCLAYVERINLNPEGSAIIICRSTHQQSRGVEDIVKTMNRTITSSCAESTKLGMFLESDSLAKREMNVLKFSHHGSSTSLLQP